MTKIIMKKQM